MSHEPVNDLTQKRCHPCEGGTPPLPRAEATRLLATLPDWILSEDGSSIRRELRLASFREAVQLIDDVARVAEAENHHPDLHLTGYRNLAVELSTHAVHGLSENDFILAAKIDQLAERPRPPEKPML
jgi:4a-hydroxytetrahydrobiopterin dehydratase